MRDTSSKKGTINTYDKKKIAGPYIDSKEIRS